MNKIDIREARKSPYHLYLNAIVKGGKPHERRHLRRAINSLKDIPRHIENLKDLHFKELDGYVESVDEFLASLGGLKVNYRYENENFKFVVSAGESISCPYASEVIKGLPLYKPMTTKDEEIFHYSILLTEEAVSQGYGTIPHTSGYCATLPNNENLTASLAHQLYMTPMCIVHSSEVNDSSVLMTMATEIRKLISTIDLVDGVYRSTYQSELVTMQVRDLKGDAK